MALVVTGRLNRQVAGAPDTVEKTSNPIGPG
jgi:hypothetical protein